jgi:hypothetical protein
MSVVAKMIDEKRYVLLNIDGRVKISDLEQSRTILKSTLHESNGYMKILVDIRNASLAVSTIDIHQFISSHKDELPSGCLIAMIMRPKDWDTAIFAEDVAHNRSIHLRVFRNDIHSYDWLGISDKY